MTRLDRRALFATGSAAALLAAVGLSAQAAPARGGHLRVALSGGDRAETWFDVPGGRFLQAARNAVFETLTDIAPDGTLQPNLSTRWTHDDTGCIWTFTLAHGVPFHDGTEMRVEDVVASLSLHPQFETVEVAQGDSVRLHLAQPNPALPFTLADGQFAIFKAEELASDELPLTGTGLYRIKRFDAGRGFLGERVEAHRKDGTAGWFDTVELVAISDESVRAEAVRDGHVDVADLSAAYDLQGRDDIDLFTEDDLIHGAIRREITHATRLGAHPLDAMRFAARWWMTG